MSKSEALWTAGFLEGKGFHVSMSKSGTIILVVSLPTYRFVPWQRFLRFANSFYGSRLRKRTLLNSSGLWGGFGERFEYNGRSAVYVDRFTKAKHIYISGLRARGILLAILPHLSKERAEVVNDVLRKYKLPKYPSIPLWKIHNIHQLRQKGLNFTKIAKRLKISDSTVRHYVKR